MIIAETFHARGPEKSGCENFEDVERMRQKS
jgi:hypothetical protein